MGQLILESQLILSTMKAFVALFALAATALAESEPWLGYGYGGYGVALASPCRNAWGVPVPCAGKKKREAEAEPWLGLGYGGYGLGYGLVSACHNAWGAPVPCAGKRSVKLKPNHGWDLDTDMLSVPATTLGEPQFHVPERRREKLKP